MTTSAIDVTAARFSFASMAWVLLKSFSTTPKGRKDVSTIL
jgi:hypothetical protein